MHESEAFVLELNFEFGLFEDPQQDARLQNVIGRNVDDGFDALKTCAEVGLAHGVAEGELDCGEHVQVHQVVCAALALHIHDVADALQAQV